MSSTVTSFSRQGHPRRDIKGHVFKVGQRVKRRQNNSSRMLFGTPRHGEIVALTWKANKAGSNYPTYAVKFDNSSIVDQYVLQMRLIPVD